MDVTRESFDLLNIKPLRKRLEHESKHTGLRLDIIQQDYLLSWVLVGLFTHPLLKETLAFKGGTALKKCYFGDYRFSEDLDFTALASLPQGKLLFESIQDACADTEQRMQKYAPMQLFIERYSEKDPHPHQQEAFKIKAQFPWQRQALTTIMVEISRDESIIFPLKSQPILHGYNEPIELSVVCYSLEEIILEKLRAILQHTKKLHERDWSRSRVRDYYDLWRIFGFFKDTLLLRDFPFNLQKKCSLKKVEFKGVDSFFDQDMINHVEKTWKTWLGPLIPQLPDYNEVIYTLKTELQHLLPSCAENLSTL